jgi:hypothetical protein
VFSDAMLASAQGQFDEAEQCTSTLTSLVQDFAMPHGEMGCLLGFAKVAIDRGDGPRASRLLAAVNAGSSPMGTAAGSILDVLYAYLTGILRDVLDPETARKTHAEGAASSLMETLDAELIRSATTAMVTIPPAR